MPIVVPQNRFRLLLAMDPRHGELSPAMRNRGVEIFLQNKSTSNASQMNSTNCTSNIGPDLQLPIEELCYYSHAFIVTEQLELMKNMLKVGKSENIYILV